MPSRTGVVVRKAGPLYWVGLIATYLLIPLILWLTGWDPGWWQAWA